VLHSFGGGSDGGIPVGLLDFKGKLYGMTDRGGYYGAGTAFSVSRRAGHEDVLLSFGCCSDGYYPEAGLIDLHGALYGTAEEGGAHGNGTAFSLDSKTGAPTVLYSFCSQQNCTDGAYPSQLIGANGMLYGTTEVGGAYERGTVFSLNPETGVETVLYSFCSQENCADGDVPGSGIIDAKGTLYGTTESGGAYNSGTLYSLDLKSNTEKVLHSFDSENGDGWYPLSGVIDVNGALYGTTYYGGNGECTSGGYNNGCGTVFTFDVNTGTYGILYSFQNSETDGVNPEAKLLDINGTLYGTTVLGGSGGEGTLFSITP
jgi:uncharacterized repeat protein (TIGR03803 family)